MNHLRSHQDKLEYWQKHLALWKQNNLTVKDYCQNNQLSVATFKYWQYRLAPETKRQSKVKLPVISFTEATPLLKPSDNTFALYFNDNVHLKIPSTFDAYALCQLIKVIGESIC